MLGDSLYYAKEARFPIDLNYELEFFLLLNIFPDLIEDLIDLKVRRDML